NNARMYTTATFHSTHHFHKLAEAPPPGVDKDCLTVVDYDITNYIDFLADPDTNPLVAPDTLAPGETCSITMEALIRPWDSRNSGSYPPTGAADRYFFVGKNNTVDIWDRNSGSQSTTLAINYFD